MSFKKWTIAVCVFLLPFVVNMAVADLSAVIAQAPAQARPDQAKPREIERITAEELKAKMAKNDQVMIIDLRASATYYDDTSRIKGAFRVKERRLRQRVNTYPFKDLPRDREIVTYCACASDEIAVRAAQVLLAAGFKRVRALKGGWQAWLKVGGPLEAKPKI